jgi:hypothetical protein
VVGDGTGHRYLEATCPGSGFRACDFLDRLPLDAGDFLWSPDPTRGVFAAADADTRRALSGEQLRFVLAVVAWDPLGQAAASSGNLLRQLLLMGVPEFRYPRWAREGFERKIPSRHLDRLRRTPAGRGEFPVDVLGWLGWASFLAGSMSIAWRVFARGREIDRGLVRMVGLVVFALLSNAAICGALSQPSPRYQARVAWLVPLCALTIEFWIRAGNAGLSPRWRGGSSG